MRKFIINNFAGIYVGHIFGKRFTALKATRIIYPYILVWGICKTFQQLQWGITFFVWWDILFTIPLLFMIWFSFSWFGLSYFELYPLKYEEMDETNSTEQQRESALEEKEFKEKYNEFKNIKLK